MPRACLPHHNEIAVDHDLDSGGKIPAGHTLYQDPQKYKDQFQLRFTAALNHIKQLYNSWSS